MTPPPAPEGAMPPADGAADPADPGPAGGLVLFHGAGGDRTHHALVALEDGLDVPVARFDFPYRRKGPGRRPPDRMPKLVAAVGDAAREVTAEWGVAPDRLVFGGRSMGGRAASMAVAEGLPAAGLVLLSYPLHPPGKPDKLRVDHFGAIACPVLVIQGRRDPFATEAELERHLAAITGPVTLVMVDGNHDPKPGLDPLLVETVRDWWPPGRRG
ncbi:MAG: alpha/beta family hydrolase [Acidimicrobiales bacterium]